VTEKGLSSVFAAALIVVGGYTYVRFARSAITQNTTVNIELDLTTKLSMPSYNLNVKDADEFATVNLDAAHLRKLF